MSITVGDTWTLVAADGLGTGIGSIPAGASIVIDEVLPPFSAGVEQVSESVVCGVYAFMDYLYDDLGVMVEAENSRRLAFAESDFLTLYTPAGP